MVVAMLTMVMAMVMAVAAPRRGRPRGRRVLRHPPEDCSCQNLYRITYKHEYVNQIIFTCTTYIDKHVQSI